MALTIGELVGFVRADSSGMQRGLSDAELRMRGFQRDVEGRLRTLDGRFATAAELMAAGLGGAAERGDGLSLSLGRVVGAAAGLGRAALSAGAMVAPLGAAVPLAAGLAATLANIAPAAGVAATGMLAMLSANAALKIGMIGVGDAITAAFDTENPEKFNEALKKLSPNAKAFVLEIKALQPAFEKLKTAVQDRLFKGLDTSVQSLARATLPTLRTALVDSAGALNDMAHGVSDTAAGLASSGQLGTALKSATNGLKNMSQLPAVLVQGLVQIGAAAGPSFERLTAAGGRALEALSAKLADAFHSGAMQTAIEDAISLIGDLVDVAKNVGSILHSVFSAAQASGAGFVGTLKEITGSIAEAFASPAVQAGLKALFSTMATLASTVGPLLASALQVVGQVLAALGPPIQTVIKALASALQPIIKALGPVLAAAAKAVGALLVALTPILPVVSQLIVVALKPLGPILDVLAKVFTALAPVVGKLASIIGSVLEPVLEGLGTVLVEIVSQFGDHLIALLPMVGQALTALAPFFKQLGKSVGELLAGVAPLLPQLMTLSLVMLGQLLPAILPLLPPLMQLATAFLRLATGVLTGVVMPVLTKLVGFIAGMPAKLAPFFTAVKFVTEKVAAAFRWLYNLLIGNSIIPDLINGIVRWFASLPGKILGGLSSFASSVVSRFRSMATQAIARAREMVSSAVSTLATLPGRAVSAISSLAGRVGSVASSAASRLRSAISSGVSSAVSVASGLPGRVAGVLSGLGGRLYGAGQSLIRGFINGIRSMIGSVANAARSAVSAARDFFPFSPAKKGPFSGRGWTLYSGASLIKAFQDGMARQAPSLHRQMASLLDAMPAMAGPHLALAGGPVGALAGAGGGGPLVSIGTFEAGGRSERQIAEELAWLAKGRG